MRRNYHRKLSANIYHHAIIVGIKWILAYPKIKSKRKRRNRRFPLPFGGKRFKNCSHNVGKSLGKGWLINSRTDVKTERRKDGETEFFLWDVEEFTFLIKYLRVYIVSFHINFYQNRFIIECVRKNFLKFLERQMTFCNLQWPLRWYLIIFSYKFLSKSIHKWIC